MPTSILPPSTTGSRPLGLADPHYRALAMTTLIAGEPLFVFPLLHANFTDTDTGATYSVKMDAYGSFIHEYGKSVEEALRHWSATAVHTNGKTIHEDWIEQLTLRNARHE
jgi:hypothetical protein